ncbi:hypothetical protein H311_04377 [Anncaliia algerae PRA109]|nr:hypothetical protein H311_04377 [Anncaliia algerae PRA109]
MTIFSFNLLIILIPFDLIRLKLFIIEIWGYLSLDLIIILKTLRNSTFKSSKRFPSSIETPFVNGTPGIQTSPGNIIFSQIMFYKFHVLSTGLNIFSFLRKLLFII